MSILEWILKAFISVQFEDSNCSIEKSTDIRLEDYKPNRLQKVIDDDLEYLDGIALVRIWMPNGVALGIVYARGEEIGRVPESIAKRLRINLDKGDRIAARIISANENECIIRCTPE